MISNFCLLRIALSAALIFYGSAAWASAHPQEQSSPMILDQELTMEFEKDANFDRKNPVLVLELGNDLIGIQPSDRYLTNTFRVGFVFNDVPNWIAKALQPDASGKSDCAVSGAQYIYTPENLRTSELQVNDRPYAGWLFVGLQCNSRTGDILLINGIEMGIVGPASGAEYVQKFVHKITGSKEPLGWEHQLKNEVGINIFKMAVKSWRTDSPWIDRELITYGGLTLGNVNTQAQAGVILRLGYNIPDDMGVSLISVGDTAVNKTRLKHSAYVFIAGEGQAVARDIFLDGNTFRESHSVKKKPFANVIRSGGVVSYGDFQVGYINSRVSERFRGQPNVSNNGLIYFRFNKSIK